MGKNEKIILLDADVIIHFYKGEHILTLKKIFPGRLFILDIVLNELNGNLTTKEVVDNFLNFGIAKRMDFPNDRNIKVEYALLRKRFGNGESACMAVSRYNKNILASSNLKDIVDYCIKYGIEYLTTMDFLTHALNNGILSESECDEFIDKVILKGSKLPCRTIKEYKERYR
ncbi:MAG: hypothetical protein WC868_00195 [Bacteroidales bacterium]